MTEPEGGPGSREEPRGDGEVDTAHETADAPGNDHPLPNEEEGGDEDDREFDEAVAGGGVVGDANDELPVSGRRPRAVTPPGRRRLRGIGRPSAPAPPAVAPTVSEIAVRIDDRISGVFVVITVGFFILLFVYAVLFGGSGLLTPKPTPRPTPVPVPTASPTPTPVPTPVPVVPPASIPSASASGSARASASPSGSAATSASPSASAAASASPSST